MCGSKRGHRRGYGRGGSSGCCCCGGGGRSAGVAKFSTDVVDDDISLDIFNCSAARKALSDHSSAITKVHHRAHGMRAYPIYTTLIYDWCWGCWKCNFRNGWKQ